MAGFTMSVRRLAEPPKPSFLLLGEVSQSHPFMCNACKPMHSDTMAQRRNMWGREWAAIKMGQSRQAPQDNNSIQNVNIEQRSEQREPQEAADTEQGGATGTWKAVGSGGPARDWPGAAQREGWQCRALRVIPTRKQPKKWAERQRLGASDRTELRRTRTRLAVDVMSTGSKASV